MVNKNVLVLSAGRRVELVEAFIKACKIYSPESKVFTTDSNPEVAPACQVSDEYFEAPRVTSPEYTEFLKSLCQEENIGLIVPTIDTELLILSNKLEEFKAINTNLIISDEKLIKLCRDKRKTAALFDSLNISNPKIYKFPDLKYPCFCKPFDGSCSIGALIIESAENLTSDIVSNSKNMFMELVGKDHCEVTVDAYYNKSGNLKCLVPRERVEVRAGEVSKGVSRKGFVYEYLLERLTKLAGARGCLTIQVFYNKETKSVKGLEVNPRFGGGFPLSNDIGAKYPEWLIREYFFDEELNFFDDWEEDVIMLRYDAKVLVSGYSG